MRIIGIDFGLKRTGIAVTDELQIIATPLKVLPAEEVIPFLEAYFKVESVAEIVVGLPVALNTQDTHGTQLAKGFIKKLKTFFPDKAVVALDERFTSKMAKDILMQTGIKKKDRMDKSKVDQLSAEIILTDYLKIKQTKK